MAMSTGKKVYFVGGNVVGMLLSLGMLAVGFNFVNIFVVDYQKINRAADWIETEAILDKCSLDVGKSKEVTVATELLCEYHYTIDDQPYSSSGTCPECGAQVPEVLESKE